VRNNCGLLLISSYTCCGTISKGHYCAAFIFRFGKTPMIG